MCLRENLRRRYRLTAAINRDALDHDGPWQLQIGPGAVGGDLARRVLPEGRFVINPGRVVRRDQHLSPPHPDVITAFSVALDWRNRHERCSGTDHHAVDADPGDPFSGLGVDHLARDCHGRLEPDLQSRNFRTRAHHHVIQGRSQERRIGDEFGRDHVPAGRYRGEVKGTVGSNLGPPRAIESELLAIR